MAGHIQTAARTDWCTPRPIVDFAYRVFGGRIRLDPCWNEQSITKPDFAFDGKSPESDGLKELWWPYGQAYVNPPFGWDLPFWVKKAITEAKLGCEIILLSPAAVGTRYWQKGIFRTAQATCFLRGRVEFLGADAGAPMDCALTYWGPGIGSFLLHAKPIGTTIRLRPWRKP